MCVSVCFCECDWMQMSEEDIWSPEAGAVGCCEPLYMAAECQTDSLKSDKCL